MGRVRRPRMSAREKVELWERCRRLALVVFSEPIQVVVVRELFCEAEPSDKQRSEGPTRR